MRTPAVSMRSLTSTGTPASAPRTPARARASASLLAHRDDGVELGPRRDARQRVGHDLLGARARRRRRRAAISVAFTGAGARWPRSPPRPGDGEAADLDERARGARGAEELLAHGVDERAVVDVEQVDGDLDDVGGRGAGGGQHALHDREDLARLGHDVVAADDGAGGVDGDDARDVERVARHDRVGVVADRLGQALDHDLAALHEAAARISSSVWRGVIACGSTRSSMSAGRPHSSASSRAAGKSSERSTSAPCAPKARA